ncbi:MAG: RsmE family RNA methyltransferase [Planctomycetota bacterium]
MNVVLFEAREVGSDNRCELHDRRLLHLRQVLSAQPGDRLRVGILDGSLGYAEVESIDDQRAVLQCAFDEPAPSRSDDTLILGIPRPNILARVLEAAVTLGFGRIALLRTRLVDKSQLQSHALLPEALQERILKGLEQSVRTARPEIVLEDRFRPFVEDRPTQWALGPSRFVGHPEGSRDLASERVDCSGPITLAIGPERGFTDFEIERFGASGFTAVRSGTQPLRVETALSVLTGQLKLQRALSC